MARAHLDWFGRRAGLAPAGLALLIVVTIVVVALVLPARHSLTAQPAADGFDAELNSTFVTLGAGTHYLYMPLAHRDGDSLDLLRLFGPEWQQFESVAWFDGARRQWVPFLPGSLVATSASRAFAGQALRLVLNAPTQVQLRGILPQSQTVEAALRAQQGQEFVGIPGAGAVTLQSLLQAGRAVNPTVPLSWWDPGQRRWMTAAEQVARYAASKVQALRAEDATVDQRFPATGRASEHSRLSALLDAWGRTPLGETERLEALEAFSLPSYFLIRWPCPSPGTAVGTAQQASTPIGTVTASVTSVGLSAEAIAKYQHPLEVPPADSATALAVDVEPGTFRVNYANDRISDGVGLVALPEALCQMTDLPERVTVEIGYDGGAPSKPISYRAKVPSISVGSGTYAVQVRPPAGQATIDLMLAPGHRAFAEGVGQVSLPSSTLADRMDSPDSAAFEHVVTMPVSIVFDPDMQPAGDGYSDGEQAGPSLDVVIPVDGSNSVRLFRRYGVGVGPRPGGPAIVELPDGGPQVTKCLWLEASPSLPGQLGAKSGWKWAKRTLAVSNVLLDEDDRIERIDCRGIGTSSVKIGGLPVPVLGADAEADTTASYSPTRGLEVSLDDDSSLVLCGSEAYFSVRAGEHCEFCFIPACSVSKKPGVWPPVNSLGFNPAVCFRLQDEEHNVRDFLLSAQASVSTSLPSLSQLPAKLKSWMTKLRNLKSAGVTSILTSSGDILPDSSRLRGAVACVFVDDDGRTYALSGSVTTDKKPQGKTSRDWSVEVGVAGAMDEHSNSLGVDLSYDSKASGARRLCLAVNGRWQVDQEGYFSSAGEGDAACDATITYERHGSGKVNHSVELRGTDLVKVNFSGSADGWSFAARDWLTSIEASQEPQKPPAGKLTLAFSGMAARETEVSVKVMPLQTGAGSVEPNLSDLLDEVGGSHGFLGQVTWEESLKWPPASAAASGSSLAGRTLWATLFPDSPLLPKKWTLDGDNCSVALSLEGINEEYGWFRPVKLEGSLGKKSGKWIGSFGGEGQFKTSGDTEEESWMSAKFSLERSEQAWGVLAEVTDVDVSELFCLRRGFLSGEIRTSPFKLEDLLLGGNFEFYTEGDRNRPPSLARLTLDVTSKAATGGFRVSAPAFGLTTDDTFKALTFDGSLELGTPWTCGGTVGVEFSPPWMDGELALASGTAAKSATGWSIAASTRNLSVSPGDWEITLDELTVGMSRTTVAVLSPTLDWTYAGRATLQMPPKLRETLETWQDQNTSGIGLSIPTTISAGVSGTGRSFTVRADLSPTLGVKVTDSVRFGLSRVQLTKASPWTPSMAAQLDSGANHCELPVSFDADSGSVTFTLPATQTIDLDLSPGPHVQVKGGFITIGKSGTATVSATATVALLGKNVTGAMSMSYARANNAVSCTLTPQTAVALGGGLSLQPGTLNLSTQTVNGQRVNVVSGNITATVGGKSMAATLTSSSDGSASLQLDPSALDWDAAFVQVTPESVRLERASDGSLGYSGGLKFKFAADLGILPTGSELAATFSRASNGNTTFTVAADGLDFGLAGSRVGFTSLDVEMRKKPSVSRQITGRGFVKAGPPLSTLMGKGDGQTLDLDDLTVSYDSSNGKLRMNAQLDLQRAFDLFGLAGTFRLASIQVGQDGVGATMVADFSASLGYKITADLTIQGTTQATGNLLVTDTGNHPTTLTVDIPSVGSVRFANMRFQQDLLGSGVLLDVLANIGSTKAGFYLDVKNGFLPVAGPLQMVFFNQFAAQAHLLGFAVEATLAFPKPVLPSSEQGSALLTALGKAFADPPDTSTLATVAAGTLRAVVCDNPLGPGLGKVKLQFPKAQFQSLLPNKSPFHYEGELIKLSLMDQASGDGWRNGIWYPLMYAMDRANCGGSKLTEAFDAVVKGLRVAVKVVKQPSALAEMVPEDKRSGSFDLNLILAEAAGGYQLTPQMQTAITATSSNVKKFFLLGQILDYLKLGAAQTGFNSMWEVQNELRAEEKRAQTAAQQAVATVAQNPSADKFMRGALRGARQTFADMNGDGKADAILLYSDKTVVCLSDGEKFRDGPNWSTAGTATSALVCFADLEGNGKSQRVVAVGSALTQLTRIPALTTGVEIPTRVAGPAFGATTAVASKLFTADLDGDGRAEAVAVVGGKLCIRKTVPSSSTWGPLQTWLSSGGSEVVAIADADGDGKADAIRVTSTGTYVHLSTGTAFGAGVRWSSASTANTALARFFVDVDGDGRADLLLVNSAGDPKLGRSDGTRFLPLLSCYPAGQPAPLAKSGSTTYHAADVDGDKRCDLIALAPDGTRILLARPSLAGISPCYEAVAIARPPAIGVTAAVATHASLTSADKTAMLQAENADTFTANTIGATASKASSVDKYTCTPTLGSGTVPSSFKVIDRWIDTRHYIDQARELETLWKQKRALTGCDTNPLLYLGKLIKDLNDRYGPPADGHTLKWNNGNIELVLTGTRVLPFLVADKLNQSFSPGRNVPSTHRLWWDLNGSPAKLETAESHSWSDGSGGHNYVCNPTTILRCTSSLVSVSVKLNASFTGSGYNYSNTSLMLPFAPLFDPATGQPVLINYLISGWKLVHTLRDPAYPDVADFKMQITDKGTVLFKGPSGIRCATVVPGKSIVTDLRLLIPRLNLLTDGAAWQSDTYPYHFLLWLWNNIKTTRCELGTKFTPSVQLSGTALNSTLSCNFVPKANSGYDASSDAFGCTIGFKCNDPRLESWCPTDTGSERKRTVDGSYSLSVGSDGYVAWKTKWDSSSGLLPMLRHGTTEVNALTATINSRTTGLSVDAATHPLRTRVLSSGNSGGTYPRIYSLAVKGDPHCWFFSSHVSSDSQLYRTTVRFQGACVTLQYSCSGTQNGVAHEVSATSSGGTAVGLFQDADLLRALMNSGSLDDSELYPYSLKAPYGAGDYLVRGYTRSSTTMVYATSPSMEADLREAIGARILLRQVVVTQPSYLAGTYVVDTETLATSQAGAGLLVMADAAGMNSTVTLSTTATCPATLSSLPGTAVLRRNLAGETSSTVQISPKPPETAYTNAAQFLPPGAAGVPEGIRYDTGVVPDPGGIYAWAHLAAPSWFEKLGQLSVDVKGAIRDGGSFLFQGLANCTILGKTCGDALLSISSSDGLYLKAMMDFVIAKSFLEGRINQSGIFMVGEVKKLVSGTGIQAKADLDTSKNPLLNIVGDVLIASAKVARATLTLGKDCLRVRLCVGNKDVGVDANIIMKYAGSNWSLCIKGRGYVDVWPFGRRSVALPTVFVNVGTGNYGASFLAGIGVCGNIPGGDIHLSSNVSNCAGAGSACNDCN